jgi:delta8-fatty-acid desaturase
VQKRVIQFCNEVGLKYEIYGFTKGNMKVLGKLGEVAKQARIMSECNKFCQQEVLNSGLH